MHVVAAENFWGNITSQLGGRDVDVTSLITNPNADPHLFETDAADAATLAQAQVVIENGAGYDTWMSSLLGADGGHPRLVNAATVLHVTGQRPQPPPLVRHPPRAHRGGRHRGRAREGGAAGRADLQGQPGRVRRVPRPARRDAGHHQARFHDVPVAYTERVPGYALAVADLDVKTPPGFARAIEDGVDPGPADTLAMQRLLDDHDINVLLYNVQTVTPVTTQMRALARQHGIPVVGVSETMPAGAATYQQWQQSQLTNAAPRARVEPQPVTAPPVELPGRRRAAGVPRPCGPASTSIVAEGEFLAVLGPNGAGKTTLAQGAARPRARLARRARCASTAPHRGWATTSSATCPSSRPSTARLPDPRPRPRPLRRRRSPLGPAAPRPGHPAPGWTRRSRPSAPRAYADAPVGLLSGGEQQRLRIAQALLGDPKVLLCDEPLLALDLASQRAVTRLIDERRRQAGTPVVFVTHEVNPVLPYVDRILYLVRGKWAIGTPAEILTSERLSDLYGIEVDVVKVRDRYLVVSAEDELPTEPGAHAHHGHHGHAH